MEWYKKLLQLRNQLGDSQEEFGNRLGIKQAHISIMEKGNRKNVPWECIEFLIQKGFDLNTFFDPSRKMTKLGINPQIHLEERIDLIEDLIGELYVKMDITPSKSLLKRAKAQ